MKPPTKIELKIDLNPKDEIRSIKSGRLKQRATGGIIDISLQYPLPSKKGIVCSHALKRRSYALPVKTSNPWNDGFIIRETVLELVSKALKESGIMPNG